MYHYESNGRLTDIVLPTGETVNLGSHLTPEDGLSVQVSALTQSLSATDLAQPQHTVTLKMEDRGAKRLTMQEGKDMLNTWFSVSRE